MHTPSTSHEGARVGRDKRAERDSLRLSQLPGQAVAGCRHCGRAARAGARTKGVVTTPETIGSKASLDRRFKRAASITTDLFINSSASKLRDHLHGHVDNEVIEEVGQLVPWRNFLAHRYFMARMTRPDGSELMVTGRELE